MTWGDSHYGTYATTRTWLDWDGTESSEPDDYGPDDAGDDERQRDKDHA